MDVIKAIEHEQLKETVPVLDVGNTVRVSVKIKEAFTSSSYPLHLNICDVRL